jgi:hypothetical protein
MPLDLPSPSAFTLPPLALLEPAGQRGIATATPLEEGMLPPFRRRKVLQENRLLSATAKALEEGLLSLPPTREGLSSATAIEAEILDPVSEYIVKKAADLVKNDRLARIRLEERVRELQVDALRNAEPFSESSLADLRSFVSLTALTERPSIFLLDDGNLRAVWRNAAKEQVGLQFLGNGVVQFVIFVQRQRPPIMSRTAGIDALANILTRIKDSACNRLLFG